MAPVQMVKKPLEAAVMYSAVTCSTWPLLEMKTLWKIRDFSKCKDGAAYRSDAADRESGITLTLVKKKKTIDATFNTKASLKKPACSLDYHGKRCRVEEVEEIDSRVYHVKFTLQDRVRKSPADELIVALASLDQDETCEVFAAARLRAVIDASEVVEDLERFCSVKDPVALMSEFVDFKIRGIDCSISAQRCILAVRSAYFRDHFLARPGDDSVYLDIPLDVLIIVLCYVYYGFVKTSRPIKLLLAVFEWAVRLEIPSLRTTLLYHLMRVADRDNALDMWNVGNRTGQKELVRVADAFLA